MNSGYEPSRIENFASPVFYLYDTKELKIESRNNIEEYNIVFKTEEV